MRPEQQAPVEPEIEVELDRPRRMRLDLNTIARIEEELGLNLMTEEIKVQELSVLKLRKFLWCLFVGDDPELTEEQVGNLFTPARINSLMTSLAELQVKAVGDLGKDVELREVEEVELPSSTG